MCPLPSVHSLGVGIVLHRTGQATTMLVEGVSVRGCIMPD